MEMLLKVLKTSWPDTAGCCT